MSSSMNNLALKTSEQASLLEQTTRALEQITNITRENTKNARKDGGYYWVFATVYPFESCDGLKGYLSCRRKASEEEISKATKLYEELIKKESY